MNTQRTIAAILAVTLITTLSAFARLGEKEAEVESRFGKPVTSPGTQALIHDVILNDSALDGWDKTQGATVQSYVHEDWVIIVVYLNGVSASETYRSPSLGMEVDDVKRLLNGNAGDKQWKLIESELNDRYNLSFKLLDKNSGKQIGEARLNGSRLTVRTAALLEVVKATREKDTKRAEEKKAKALDDF